MLILRSAGASPFGRKVRIVASVLGFDGRIEVKPADTADPKDSLRTQNPPGKIPALILENGEVVFDSAVIVEYLDWLAGGGKAIPSAPEARFRTLTLQALGDGICEAAGLQRYERVMREPQERSEKWVAYQGERSPARFALSKPRPAPLRGCGNDRSRMRARLSRPPF